MHRYKELHIWNRAIKITKPIYDLANTFPDDERFGLVSQIKRAVVSVSLNIAEGAGRRTDKDFSHYLDIAIGSLNEVETCIYVAVELKFFKIEQAETMLIEVEELLKMIVSFKKKLNKV